MGHTGGVMRCSVRAMLSDAGIVECRINHYVAAPLKKKEGRDEIQGRGKKLEKKEPKFKEKQKGTI
jgi:hypothetical protein